MVMKAEIQLNSPLGRSGERSLSRLGLSTFFFFFWILDLLTPHAESLGRFSERSAS